MEMTKHLTKKDLNRVFWRMQVLNITNNFESMQAIGFLSSFTPVLERLYADRPEEERINAMERHLQFFNSHVNADALILGITAAIEETTTEDEKETVVSIKTGLMGPLAGIGDSLLKFTWLPICGSIGASLALTGNLMGPVLMFVLYNVVNVASKYYGIHWGYKKGLEVINSETGTDIMQRVSNMANVVGLMVIGSLIASVVKVNLVAEFSAGENTILLQEMLDKVMPGLLSLLVTLGVYQLLKKTQGKHAALIILAIMTLSIALTVLKVIG
ncbi:PTS system mannose/fructose/sorbose family transporter subunit IID [Carnobacterium maltaromaticum]|uniref:PTS system mannose/fructose/sorbose family transporter subunit IID n=1 Tax=Carnobacterium maltaromaticum TaxID=2751 RepID=UPI0039BDCABB